MESKSILYGFEDFEMISIPSSIFETKASVNSYDLMGYFYSHKYMYLPVEDDVDNVKPLGITNHKEILNTAKSMYIHPSCKIPRTLVSQKYKKELNPWTADAVVIPEKHLEKYGCWGSVWSAIFVNEEKHLIVCVEACFSDTKAKFLSYPMKSKIKDLVSPETLLKIKSFSGNSRIKYNIDDMLDAELDYTGTLIYVEPSDSYIIDVLTNTIPKDKVVFEKSVIASLGSSENTITEEAIVSLNDMLSSTDDAVVGSAIKALSAMDYYNYPNTIKYLLKHSSNFRYNKASDSTAAKFMFKYLTGGTARGHINYTDRFITQKDWDMFYCLLKSYNYTDFEIKTELKYLPFIYEDANFNLYPRIRQ